MTVDKRPNGRWRGRVLDGRTYVSSQVFDTKKEATAYVAAERSRLGLDRAGGSVVDPRAARRRLVEVVPLFLAYREDMVAERTLSTDRFMLTSMAPVGLLQRSVGTVTAADVERVLVGLLAEGAAHSSVVRFRASLRGFFTWAVRNGFRADNPVSSALMPRRTEPRREMHPWSAAELEDRFRVWSALNADAAEVVRFLALTALRWSEARALLVSDVSLVPYPSVLVQRARPEGTAVKTTKNTQHRRVPLAAPVVPYVRARMVGRSGSDLLLPPMHRGRLTAQLNWSDTAGGRTLHDARHTAVCLWIASGVDLATVRAWAGHSDLSITSRYVHYLGSAADRASLARLNAVLTNTPADGASESETGS